MSRPPGPGTYATNHADDAFIGDPRAACSGADPDLFFSEGWGKDAKDICARCPLVDPCREYAVARPWLAGVWGGTSGNDRDRIRRERREAAT